MPPVNKKSGAVHCCRCMAETKLIPHDGFGRGGVAQDCSWASIKIILCRNEIDAVWLYLCPHCFTDGLFSLVSSEDGMMIAAARDAMEQWRNAQAIAKGR